jgi:hypothetical protein
VNDNNDDVDASQCPNKSKVRSTPTPKGKQTGHNHDAIPPFHFTVPSDLMYDGDDDDKDDFALQPSPQKVIHHTVELMGHVHE